MKELHITCFGEVLWDVFPKHRKIGGAPLNVAIRLKSFDNNVSIISKVGKDSLGDLLLEFLEKKELSTLNIQIDTELKTGEVQVSLNEKGSATYDIIYPCAWDNIELTNPDKILLERSDAFIFGSLIGRNKTSKKSLLNLLKLAFYKIFDVNLRAPYYNFELLIELMNIADFIKFNDEELVEISKYLGSGFSTIEQNVIYISEKTNTNHICVTKGENGAVLYYDNQFYNNKGYNIDVIDTVGAGDSFLATLINYLLKNHAPQEALNSACAVGALVAQCEGANPEISSEDIEDLLKSQLEK